MFGWVLCAALWTDIVIIITTTPEIYYEYNASCSAYCNIVM